MSQCSSMFIAEKIKNFQVLFFLNALYVQCPGPLGTKLAPARPLLEVHILHWGEYEPRKKSSLTFAPPCVLLWEETVTYLNLVPCPILVYLGCCITTSFMLMVAQSICDHLGQVNNSNIEQIIGSCKLECSTLIISKCAIDNFVFLWNKLCTPPRVLLY